MGYHEGERHIFTLEMDEALSINHLELADRFCGFSSKKAGLLSFEFSVKNDIELPTSWLASRKAGKKGNSLQCF